MARTITHWRSAIATIEAPDPVLTVRAALDIAAGGICNTVQKRGDVPCFMCRSTTRQLILDFLDELPAVRVITPLELRMALAAQAGDA